ncbi:hypothetical protein, partial [Litorivivens sp.]|uniref:hypothetical protein n=1 Tax=Litorivivens sp. TaxID=2020868 RepID=UPI00356A258C
MTHLVGMWHVSLKNFAGHNADALIALGSLAGIFPARRALLCLFRNPITTMDGYGITDDCLRGRHCRGRVVPETSSS